MKTPKGLSLIELLMGMGLVSLVVLAAFHLVKFHTDSQRATAAIIDTQTELREFLEVQKTFLNSSQEASFANCSNMSLPVEQRVCNAITIDRDVITETGSTNINRRIAETICVPNTTGTPIDNRILQCVSCDAGQMPVIRVSTTVPAITYNFPISYTGPGDTRPFSAALCIRRSTGGALIGMRLLALSRNLNGSAQFHHLEASSPNPTSNGKIRMLNVRTVTGQ